jgi:hypothetical protein
MRTSAPQQTVTVQASSAFAPWQRLNLLSEETQRSRSETIVAATPEHHNEHGKSSCLSCNFAQFPIFSKPQIAFQPKLAIGQPNDVYEQEADQIADHVMRMPEP